MAVLAPPDWLYPPRDNTMDVPATPRQRSSPANDHSASPSPPHHHQQQQQQIIPPQQQQALQQPSYTYPVQQQAQGNWTPSIAAAPFYPSFYQNHQQQQSPQPYPSPLPQQPPYFDPANAQLAQWAYQQMMFNAQHGFPPIPPQHHSSPQQRPGTNPTPSNDYFAQNQIPSPFNSFPSGTPPPHAHRSTADHQQQAQQNGQYPGFHPYRRPNRQAQHSPDTNDWRPGGVAQVPHPPYARPEASGSTSSVNSSSSRQRTNSNQSASSGQNVPPSNSGSRPRNNGASAVSPPGSTRPSPSPSSSASTIPSPLRAPHHRNASSSSSTSVSSATRQSSLTPSLPSASSTSSSSVPLASPSPNPRPARPSPLSQGNFTAGEKRMSRDDSDLAAMREATPSSGMLRSGGLKGRLRRALSFNAAQTLQEEETDDDESIKASALNGGASSSKFAAKAPAAGNSSGSNTRTAGSDNAVDDTASTATVQTKKKGRAASLFNSRLNASTDNISLSSTVSSASVMIRKLGSMGKLARRNSLAGITSLFKDKEKNKDGEGKDKKGKKKDKSAKAEASVASVSHVTAELDRTNSNDWSVGAEMNGLSPAAKLARQHTLKSNAEAAAKAKAQQEAQAAAAATAATAASVNAVNGNGIGINGAGVPTWDKNTATRAATSPVKGGVGVRVSEDGTRVLVEDDDDESDEGHYGPQQAGQSFHADGWDDDEDWDAEGDGEGDEDVTIRVGMERSSLEDPGYGYGPYQDEPEPWAVDVRRSVERTRKPAKGILKNAGQYDQQSFVPDQSGTNRVRSNSYNSPSQTELGPLARIPSPDPDHIDGLHRHGSHSSSHGSSNASAPSLPPLSFESSPVAPSFSSPKELPDAPAPISHSHSVSPPPPPEKSPIFQHPNMNSSAPVLSSIMSSPPTLTHRSATTPSKRLAFATNLSIYDTFSASMYDRRSEPATWSRLTPALAQRIKEELNSYKMEEMEVHAASRIHTQFFV